MKKIVLLTIVMLGLGVDSYALDFRGLRLGMTPSEICEWLQIDFKPEYENIKIMELARMAENQLRGEGITSARVTITLTGGVQQIELLIYQDDSEAYQKALHKKYGNPTTSKQIPYTNSFGVKMTGLQEMWKIGEDYIFFATRPKSVEEFSTILIFATKEWFQSNVNKKKTEPKL